jgi:2-desacetyl-2-hydroxyethyl bacteriochlorophyllide A dehydrogenase
MKATVLRKGQLVVDDVAEPVPGADQVLLETIACGICGSDLHCAQHAASFVASSRACGMSAFDFDVDADLVMGHEFSGHVLEVGDEVDGVRAGQVVVAHPIVRTADGAHSVGYANDYPGGYGQRMVVDARGVLAVPTGLDPRLAALTEPMAVGLHAANAAQVDATRSAVVLGCGPVGLATIAALRFRGVPLIVAADFAPARRQLATALGAHVVVDPATETAIDAWRAAGGRRRTVVIDAIGVPGIIDAAMKQAPRRSQIVVVGLCMETDGFWPAIGVNKELTISFVLGWTPEEFSDSLHGIADGRLDVGPLVTGEVGLEGVAEAFATLAHPDHHAKILVRPNGA